LFLLNLLLQSFDGWCGAEFTFFRKLLKDCPLIGAAAREQL